MCFFLKVVETEDNIFSRRKSTKKIVAFMISVMMAWSLIPTFAFAEGGEVSVSTKVERWNKTL